MNFFVVSWKEFNERKMVDKAEIVKEETSEAALIKMKTFNEQRRLTTTDYRTIDLTEKLSAQSLEIVEKVIVE